MKTKLGFVTGACVALMMAAGCGDDDTGSGGSGGDGGSLADGGGGAGGTGGSGGSGTGTGTGTGTGGAGGDGAGGAMTMGASAECQACVADLYTNDPACAANVQTCDDDPGCDAWKNCNEDCFNENDTVACYQACDAQFPHDTDLSEPLLTCTCDACGDLCQASCAAE